MRLNTNKIPLEFTCLPDTYVMINRFGGEMIELIIKETSLLGGKPSSSNASFKQIAQDLGSFRHGSIWLSFYYSKNPFVGHKVISHATNRTINFNTRFHSVKTYKPIDWFSNIAHEIVHISDQASEFSYNHKNQNDYNSAPMVIARIARKVFMENIDRWVK